MLRALAACGAPFLVPIGSRAAQNAPLDRVAQTAASYFGDVDAVRAIGDAYLRQLGRDQSVKSILAAARSALRTIERARNQETAVSALIRAVRRDFQDRRSVQLEGWVLSRTEAELCALTLLPSVK
jgi:hypothetical protein